MITYILTSIILSLFGAGMYLLLVRRQTSPIQQKQFLYIVILGSLILPLFPGFPGIHSFSLAPEPQVTTPVENGVFGHPLFDPISHTDLQHFCNCKQPDYSHRVLYRTNSFYNLLLDNKHYLSLMIGIAVLLVLIRFGVRLIYLRKLIRQSEQRKFTFEGKTVFLLKHPEPIAVGAFQLVHDYLIWQDDMDQLPEKELNAVIAHEISHLQQKNTLEKVCLNILQCIWLFNPAFYLFRKELDLISEWIADQKGAAQLGSKKAYAHLLLTMKSAQFLPTVQYFKQKSLKKRIQLLLSLKNLPKRD